MTEFRDKLLGLTKLRYELMPLLMDEMRPENGFDPVAKILKCHLLTEQALDALVKYCFAPNGVAILDVGLRYRQKLDLVQRQC